jgi:HTH-type transcriptional regulator/antitoxin HigA
MLDTASNTVPSPGSFIAEELEARGWTQLDLAFVLGVTAQAINPIIQGKRSIGPDMAKALGKAFDVPAEFFTNLQAAYDLSKAGDPDPAVERRARLQERFPIREMIKRGWFEASDSELLDVQIARFFNVSSLDDVPHMMSHAAKKTYYDETPPAQLAWLFRVRQLARSVSVAPYSEKKLREAVEKMATLRAEPEETRHVPRLLAECGVRFVLVEALPRAQIDGVCFWLDKSSPVIGMSILHDRIDNFWFVLRHEIEHVLQRHGQSRECMDFDISSDSPDTPEEEIVANEAAADFCVPSAQMKSFIDRVRPFFYEHRVLLFAQRMQVHPGIVVGQIQRRTKNYAFLRKHQVKIRQLIAPSALVDGWGNVAPVSL